VLKHINDIMHDKLVIISGKYNDFELIIRNNYGCIAYENAIEEVMQRGREVKDMLGITERFYISAVLSREQL